MALRLVTGPTSEPVTLAQAKKHLYATSNDQDALISACLIAAREAAEHKTNRSLLPQTWRLTLDAFPGSGGIGAPWHRHFDAGLSRTISVRLLKSPVTSISSIAYLNDAGEQITLDPSLYLLDKESEPARLVPAYGRCWPSTRWITNAVTIEYVAGYTDADAVPEGIKRWMLLRLGAMFENREEVIAEARIAAIAMPFADGLLDRYCVDVY